MTFCSNPNIFFVTHKTFPTVLNDAICLTVKLAALSNYLSVKHDNYRQLNYNSDSLRLQFRFYFESAAIFCNGIRHAIENIKGNVARLSFHWLLPAVDLMFHRGAFQTFINCPENVDEECLLRRSGGVEIR